MKQAFLKHLSLAIIIWLFAVVLNTGLGTVYLVAIKFLDATSLLSFGSLYGAIFSFPIMIAILIIINRYSKSQKKGLRLFNAVFTTSLVLTIMVFLLFWNMMGLHGLVMGAILQLIAIISGVISLMTFYSRLVKCGGDFNKAHKI